MDTVLDEFMEEIEEGWKLRKLTGEDHDAGPRCASHV